MEDIKTNNLLDLDQTIAKSYLEKYEYPYEAVSYIKDFINEIIENLDRSEYLVHNNIAISFTANVSDKAILNGPVIIGHNAVIRPFSYIRGNVIVGEDVVIGNSSEVKNSILFNNAQIPHFNYVGDSIMGYKSHIGAGVKISNLKSDKSDVTIKYNNDKLLTNRRKLGAIIGDFVEVGCNAVLNPGTIIGRNTTIYPLSNVVGFISENKIYKDSNNIIEKK